MEKLVANLSGKVQTKTLAGRKYLVAPVTMILEGVFAGNQGAIFYEGREISKSAQAWNNRPITVGHPEAQDGVKISGCTPEALDKFGIGMILNASWNPRHKKLKAEAWFEESRLDVIPGGSRIKEALSKDTPLEVSTGLFVDNAMENGVFNGREYQAKARNFKPDHLAIILNGVGACSLKDGAGLLVNKSEVAGVAHYELNGKKYAENFTVVDDKVTLIGVRTEISPEPLVTNTKVTMSKEQLFKSLGDEHKAFVESLSDAQADAIAKLERTVTVEVPVTNQAKNLDEVLALAPADVKELIQSALVVNENHRASLVAKVKTNPSNAFSDEELGAMGTPMLEKLASFVANAAPAKTETKSPAQYAGSAPPATETKHVEAGFLPPSTFKSKG